MNTIIAQITQDPLENEKIFAQAGEILRAGGLVAFPTETVYGLGGDAFDEDAARKIYAAKGRPSDNPLIVHIADKADLYKLSREVTKEAELLSEKFWPGPLTMILKKQPSVPSTITGGLDTVAIRMPVHKTAMEMIKASGVYVAAPSANLSGKPSPTRASHCIHDLKGRVDMIIADDTVDIGVESTIIDLSSEVPTLLRPGYITLEQLQEVLGHVEVDPAIKGAVVPDGVVPKAPGMKYKHYAPDASLSIVEGEPDAVVAKINELVAEGMKAGKKVGVMATEETKGRYPEGIVRIVGSHKDEATVAHNLFAVLREFDELKVDLIYSEGFSTEAVGTAVMNRLIKAAGHTIIMA